MYKQYLHGVESFRAGGTADAPMNFAAAGLVTGSCLFGFIGVAK